MIVNGHKTIKKERGAHAINQRMAHFHALRESGPHSNRFLNTMTTVEGLLVVSCVCRVFKAD